MSNVDRIISATVETTGEVIEYHVPTPKELSNSYRDVEAHLEAYRKIKASMLATSMNLINNMEKE